MNKLDNIADAIKCVDEFQQCGCVARVHRDVPLKKGKLKIRAFIFACKSFCFDRGISISEPSEEIEIDWDQLDPYATRVMEPWRIGVSAVEPPEKVKNDFRYHLLRRSTKMIDEFIQKEAYALAQYDARCFEGWDIIRESISNYTSL